VTEQYPAVLAAVIERFSLNVRNCSKGSLVHVEERLRPAVGKSCVESVGLFGNCGFADGDSFESFRTSRSGTAQCVRGLGDVVSPHFAHRNHVRSGRYYARGAPTQFCLRHAAVSHCVGTSLGGAPLFAVPLKYVKTKKDRDAFLEHANWHREQDHLLVMRLTPERAALLFGPFTEEIAAALSKWEAGATRKYRLVGNMVAPIVAKAIAEILNEFFGHSSAAQSELMAAGAGVKQLSRRTRTRKSGATS
jgi:hypothetical protein